MYNHKFKIHDYTNYENEDVCIGGPGLDAEHVNMCLSMAGGQECEFDISSIGGELKAAIDMFDAIKNYGNADTRIGAMAASSAGIVAMAGRKVTMSKYGLLMLHKPMVSAGGNADDLSESVKLLNVMQGRIAQIYIDKSGLDEVTINSLINAETWLTADQALDLGFIDAIEDGAVGLSVSNHASMLKHVKLAPAVYQNVFNKLKITNTDTMKVEDQKLIDETNSLLTKVMNFFKRATQKTVTNKGAINSLTPLAVGVAVSNEAGEDLEDGEYEVDNVTYTVANSLVTAMAGGEDETIANESETEAEKEDVKNETVLNSYSLKVTNKVEAASIAKVITNQAKELNDSAALIVDLNKQIKVLNAAVDRDKDAIKAEIQSEFTPDGSQRSNTTRIANKGAMPEFLQKSLDGNPMVSNAAKNAKVG